MNRILTYLALLIFAATNGCDESIGLEEQIENHFEGTTHVKTIGDSIRIEYEEINDLTIKHFIVLDSIGEISFINNTVSKKVKLMSLISDSSFKSHETLGFVITQIGQYEIRSPMFPEKDNDKNYIISDSTYTYNATGDVYRYGEFRCFLNNEFQDDAYALEMVSEGNGTYQNEIYLIVPSKNDTINFSNVYDKWLPKTYTWKWEDLSPMTWREYQIKKKELNNINLAMDSILHKQ